jgi:2'-5' RNA ligase
MATTWYKEASAEDKPMEFGCVMVDASPEVAKAAADFQKTIDPEDIYDDEEGFGLEEESHVTVKFGVHTKDPKEVQEALEGMAGGEATLGVTSIFENGDKDGYDVVKVGVESADLRRLNKAVSDNLEVTDAFPDYKPHLTLAYVRPGKGKKYAGKKDFEGMSWTFDVLDFSNADKEHTDIKLEKDG